MRHSTVSLSLTDFMRDPARYIDELATTRRPMTLSVDRRPKVVLVDAERCRDLRRRNSWMLDFLPNATIEGDESRLLDLRVARWQRAAEWVLSTRVFAPFENWERERKIAKLRTVRSRRPEVGAPDESSFSAEVCKGHMVGNSAGIDRAWRERLSRYRP